MMNLITFGSRPGGSIPRSFAASAALALSAAIVLPAVSFADEQGVSFWLPGLFGSLAAVPQHPGWQVSAINYFDSVSASGAAAAAREITVGKLSQTVNVNLNVNVKATLDLVLVDAGYVFATPVFGGQLNLAMFGLVGPNSAALNRLFDAGIRSVRRHARRQYQPNHDRFRRFIPTGLHPLEQWSA